MINAQFCLEVWGTAIARLKKYVNWPKGWDTMGSTMVNH
jgi:hypothetical protein